MEIFEIMKLPGGMPGTIQPADIAGERELYEEQIYACLC